MWTRKFSWKIFIVDAMLKGTITERFRILCGNLDEQRMHSSEGEILTNPSEATNLARCGWHAYSCVKSKFYPKLFFLIFLKSELSFRC